MSKRCPRCGEEKTLDQYSKNRCAPKGVQAYCKPCFVAAKAPSSQPLPTRICRVCRVEQDTKSYGLDSRSADGLSRRCASCVEVQRVKRRGYERERQRRLYKTPEYRAASRQTSLRYLARKAGASGDFTKSEWKEVLGDFNQRCAYCHEAFSTLHQEHMKALSRGGSHTRDNIVPACASCNSRKGTKLLVEFLVECSKS